MCFVMYDVDTKRNGYQTKQGSLFHYIFKSLDDSNL